METGGSYVYFSFFGDNFNPIEITKLMGINPTFAFKKGDIMKYGVAKYSSWELSTEKGKVYHELHTLVNEIVDILFDKIEIINEIKKKYKIDSILNIIMDIDINPEQFTPSLGYDLKALEFLYKTKTETDVDIYKFNSSQLE